MSANAIRPQREMPHFYPSGIFEGDYLRANSSVLLACQSIVTCDFNWSLSRSIPKFRKLCISEQCLSFQKSWAPSFQVYLRVLTPKTKYYAEFSAI